MTTHDHKDPSTAGTDEINEDRRAALKSVAKYAAFLAGTSAVILKPEEALAKKNCSVAQQNNGNNCI